MTNRITRQGVSLDIKTSHRERCDLNSQWITFLYMKSCSFLARILGWGEYQLRSKPIQPSELLSKLSWYPSWRNQALACLSVAGWGQL
jgi:hypothetical protein